MTQHPVVLAIALALATSFAVSGCDRTASLTEQEHIQRAKDFEDKGNLKGSILELKNAIQKNPDSPQARLLLGQLYLKVGMGAEAEKELTRAKKLGVNQETVNPHLGEALILAGEYKRVLDEIQAGEQASQANRARILQLRGDALLRLGQLQGACDLYQQSLDIDTNNPQTYWGMAQCSVAKRDLPRAKEWLGTALKIEDKQAKSWILLGDLKQLENDIEGVLEAYSNAIKLEPENLEALHNRAAINTRLGRLDPARADFEKIRKLAPKSVSASYLQALIAFKEKNYPEARAALNETLKIAPDYLPALLLGGLIEFALGNLQTAESHLNKVVRADPGNGIARRVLAATQLRQGRPEDAEKTLAPFDFEKVKDPGVLTVAGDIAIAKKEFSKAAYYYEKAAKHSPDNAAIRTDLGVARLAQGDSRAMADLQAAAAMQDSTARADTLIIQNQLNQRQFDAALASVAALEKKQPQSPIPWNYRGAAYVGKNDGANARRSFEHALKLDPGFFPAAANLAQLDLVDEKPENARKRFDGILKADPTHLQAMLAQAELSLQLKDEKSYRDWLEKAAKAHPQSLLPREKIVNYQLGNKEHAKALATAREALSANPDNPAALNLLGSTQLAAGDITNAITTYTLLTKKVSQSPDAFQRLAAAHLANKSHAQARAALQTALKLDPGHLPSLDTQLRLELAEKKPDAALQVARQIQAAQPKSPLGFDREGDILMSQKRLAQATKAYEQALANGGGTGVLIKLHGALRGAGDTRAADQRLDDWLKQNPSDWVARTYAAEYYLFTRRDRDAITLYESLLKAAPDNALALNNLATIYQRVNDKRALATAEQALKLSPNNPGILDTVGWILVEQGQATRGLDLLGKAVAKAPDMGTYRYHYAVALARAGNRAEAKKELNKALSSGKNFPEIEAARALQRELQR